MNRFVYTVLPLCLLASIALTGCGPSAKKRLTGKWEGKLVVDESQQNTFAKFLIDKANQFGSLTFELNADGTMKSRLTIGASTKEVTGQWRVIKAEGDVVTAEITDVNLNTKTKVVREATITFEDDDHFITTLPNSNAKLRFTRVPK